MLFVFSKIWKWNKKFFLFYIPSRLVSIPVSLLTLWISRQVIDYPEIGKGIGEIAIYVILLFTALCGLDMLSSWLLGHVWSYDSLFVEQKLLIARALLKNVHTYIFDESSASLDPPSELDINEKLFRLGTDKTVILISHRLFNMKDVDIIYNIEHGRVIEAGCHDDLIRNNGKYVEMYNAQSESYNA